MAIEGCADVTGVPNSVPLDSREGGGPSVGTEKGGGNGGGGGGVDSFS
jgi:hypothetical protein